MTTYAGEYRTATGDWTPLFSGATEPFTWLLSSLEPGLYYLRVREEDGGEVSSWTETGPFEVEPMTKPTITPRYVSWLEVWSDLAAAGGQRLAFIPHATDVRESVEHGVREALSVTLPMQVWPGPMDSAKSDTTSGAWAHVDKTRVIRAVFADDTWSEWRIVRVGRESGEDGARMGSFEAEGVTLDLNRGVVERIQADGTVEQTYSFLDQSPADNLTEALTRANPPLPWFQVGTVEKTDDIPEVVHAGTVLAIARDVAEKSGGEFSVERQPDGTYHLCIRNAVGADAPIVELEAGHNLRSLRLDEDATELANRIIPLSAEEDGWRMGMGGAIWSVDAVSAGRLKLSGVPVAFDGQFTGNYLELAGTTTRTAILNSWAATQEVSIASGALASFPVGSLVRFRRDAAGIELTYVQHPSAASSTLFPMRLELDDIPAIDNLLLNPWLDQLDGGVPAHWSEVIPASVTLTPTSDELYVQYGSRSVLVDATVAGAGIVSGWAPVSVTEKDPYASAQTALWLVDGAVRLVMEVEYKAPDGTLFVHAYPPAGDPAKTDETGVWVENLGVGGIDLFNADADLQDAAEAAGLDSDTLVAKRVRMAVLAHGGAARFYLDAAQLTQTASGAEVFYSGHASNELHEKANEALVERWAGREEYQVSIADLYRMDPDGYAGKRLSMGGAVDVYDEALSITKRVRVVGIEYDHLSPLDTQLVLGNLSRGFSDALAKANQPGPRRIPRTLPQPEPDPTALSLIDFLPAAPTADPYGIPYRFTRGPSVKWVYGAARTFAAPETEEKWQQVRDAFALIPADELFLPMPADGQVTLAEARPYSLEMEEGPRYHARITGQPPVVDFEITFPEAADGLTATLTVVATDPRGVVSGVNVFVTPPGDDEQPAVAATLSAPLTWTRTITLHPKHDTSVRLEITRNDGQPPFLRGPYRADRGKIPAVPTVTEVRTDDQALLMVDSPDTDTASLWYREDVAGVLGPETSIPPRGSDVRFGSYTVTAGVTERRFRVYAKNSAGVAGEYKDVRVTPYLAVLEYATCTARIMSSTASTVTVQVDAEPADGTVKLVAVRGSASRSSGLLPGVAGPSGSQWVFNRGAINTGAGQAEFTAEASGVVSDPDLVSIEEQGRDTVRLGMRARVTGSDATSVTVRVEVSDPYPSSAVTVSHTSQGTGTVSPVSPQTIAAGSVTNDFATTGFVSFTIPRAAAGTGMGRVTFTATATGRAPDSDAVDVPSQDVAVPVYMSCVAQIIESSATQITVQVYASGASGGQVTLLSTTGGATYASGPLPGAASPSGTQWVLNRGAFGTGAGQALFSATAPGTVSDTDAVTVEEQGRDTVPLQMSARVLSVTATSVVVRVAVADPYPSAAVSVAYTSQGTGTVTPASPQTVSGVTNSLGTTGSVDFTVPFGPQSGRVTFTATASGRASDSDAVDTPGTQGQDGIADVRTITATNDGGVAKIVTTHDADTVTGVGMGEYRVDGGSALTFTIDSGGVGRFDVSRSSTAVKTVEARGKNGAGAWGPWKEVGVEATADEVIALAKAGCTVTLDAGEDDYLLTWQVTGPVTSSSHALDIQMFRDGVRVDGGSLSAMNPTIPLYIHSVTPAGSTSALHHAVYILYEIATGDSVGAPIYTRPALGSP